jgi:pimeloyl-ACP methyl ester carboxylesterase
MYPAGSNVASAQVSTRVISLGGRLRVRVAESGPSSGPAIVLLHGWGASLFSWRHALESLSGIGLRVVAPDLRGFGLSEKPHRKGSYTADAYCADAEALLDALSLERAVLGGHSMGGGIALRLALRIPSRTEKLVLVNPVGLSRMPFVEMADGLPRAVARLLGKLAVPRWVVRVVLRRLLYADPSLVSESAVDEYWAPTGLPGYARAAFLSLIEFPWGAISDAEAGGLSVPTLVIGGRRDRLVLGTEAGANRLRRADVHMLDGGHCVHEERPAEVLRLIETFLSR